MTEVPDLIIFAFILLLFSERVTEKRSVATPVNETWTHGGALKCFSATLSDDPELCHYRWSSRLRRLKQTEMKRVESVRHRTDPTPYSQSESGNF